MKTSHAVALTISAVLITVAIEETRMASLRSAKAISGPPQVTKISRGTEGTASAIPPQAPALEETPPARSPRVKPEPSEKEEPTEMGQSIRKMWDNPAGKSMMDQGVKMAVAMMYGDFIESLELTKEEKEYFQKLLGKQSTDQQELAMKMMGASPADKKELMAEMTKRDEENEKAIKTFLNNDTDIKKFEEYKSRLPERQQLDGIRAAMTGASMPLTPETETKVLDAMYRARTQSGSRQFDKPEDMDALMSGGAVEEFEDGWTKQQSLLRKELTDVLNPTQLDAFFVYQGQMKEFQMMGLKMAEKMMSGDKPKAE